MLSRCFTMTSFFDIALAPLARFIVTSIGSISGVSPTATASENNTASIIFPLRMAFMANMNTTSTSTNLIMSHVKSLMPLSNEVSKLSLAIFFAIWLNSVYFPVVRTMHVADPLTTDVPMNAMFCRSFMDSAFCSVS